MSDLQYTISKDQLGRYVAFDKNFNYVGSYLTRFEAIEAIKDCEPKFDGVTLTDDGLYLAYDPITKAKIGKFVKVSDALLAIFKKKNNKRLKHVKR